jgi:hypothetical protein
MKLLTDVELRELPTGSEFVFDVESYPNFWMVAFKHIESGGIVILEDHIHASLSTLKLAWMLWNFKVIGFNSKVYDIPQVCLAINGLKFDELYTVTKRIISNELKHWQVEQEFKVNFPEINHIDIFDVCPLVGSLKLYGGRLHCETIRDLPYDPNVNLTYDQSREVIEYCCNDLDLTILNYCELSEQFKLREQLSSEYDQDLRSKSDAQIAEAVIGSEVYKLTGTYPKKPKILPGTEFRYSIPAYIGFRTLKMQTVLETVRNATFVIDNSGYPKLPSSMEKLKIPIGESIYKLALGGLHSTEKSIAHYSDADYILKDVDVESYYPRIILNQGLFPQHIGESFLEVYESIVTRRVEAKRAKNTIVSDSLKITINGSFGKFGSKYSILYSPDLLIQVTITGQLSLLMLIEYLELVGIAVVSANTDGIVIKCLHNREEELNGIIKQWEAITNFTTEETIYNSIFNRDVNNYIAVKPDGKVKRKGCYSNNWIDLKLSIFRFHKNPDTQICSDAVVKLITDGVPIEDTIRNCVDIKQFVVVKNVRGGAIKDDKYIGKVVRWYYSKGERTCIKYKSNGNKVAKSDGAKALMTLGCEFPQDINYDWYINEANEILYNIGYHHKLKTGKLF